MRYFGTDGIRDKADLLIAKNIPYRLGRVISDIGGKIIIARDVRTHSEKIEQQLCNGLLSDNTEVWVTGVLPTPALSYIAKKNNADYAIMITASHNGPEFNGIKVFGKDGKKLSIDEENALDNALFNYKAKALFDNVEIEEAACDIEPIETYSDLSGKINSLEGASFRYKKHIKKMFPRFDGVKVRLDCAHGCCAEFADEIFKSLGAIVVAENNTRDGKRVNVNCGSTHIENFVQKVKKDEIGFSFDGDGDRVLAVEKGKIYDGDAILLAISLLYMLRGRLNKKFIVGTTLSNTRLQKELTSKGIALLRSQVGDKYILDTLIEQDCLIGGEKSGHVIILDKAETGDGIITALTLLDVKKTMGTLPKFCPYPMLEINIPAKNPKIAVKNPKFVNKITKLDSLIYSRGRIIVRPSGTEPFIRVTIEIYTKNYEDIFEKAKEILDYS